MFLRKYSDETVALIIRAGAEAAEQAGKIKQDGKSRMQR